MFWVDLRLEMCLGGRIWAWFEFWEILDFVEIWKRMKFLVDLRRFRHRNLENKEELRRSQDGFWVHNEPR